MQDMKNYIVNIMGKLLQVHSPLGYHEEIIPVVQRELEGLGYDVKHFNRGGISTSIGEGNHIAVTSHLDEIGLAIRQIKENGRMSLCKIGGLYAKTLNESDCEVVTLDGRKYSGTIRHKVSSVHLSERDEYSVALDLDTNMELILDEPVKNKADVEALGINNGDFVLLDPRTKFLSNGFIKSRFIDDKACVAIMLAALKTIKENNLVLNKKLTAHFSVYEENGTGGCIGLDDDVKELLALDIGCVGDSTDADETKVSIVAKDSRSHYSRELIQKFVNLSNANNIEYSIDVNYPHYGSDTGSAIAAGHDILFGLIGPGVFASHGYERTHIDGVMNTYKLLMAYLTE